MWTSDLSMDEAVVLDEVGLDPIDLVIGSSYFHTGVQWGKWGQNMELEALTTGLAEVRRHALAKAVHHAAQVGADGLVGVRVEANSHAHHAHFVLTATAVRARDASWRGRGPFTCHLSGQELLGLARAGWRPRALVMGVCVYHVAHLGLRAALSSVGQNREMTNYTTALYDARELAMTRMEADAIAAGGTGVVGMDVTEGNHGWHAHVLEFLAMGTAIARADAAHLGEPLDVRPVVSVDR